MNSKSDVLHTLQSHVGANNGVTAEQLGKALGINKRTVRTHVTELRLEGIAVCGHPTTGYYIAATDADIEATCSFLRSRAMHSLTLESRLRRVTLPELLGQMRLKT